MRNFVGLCALFGASLSAMEQPQNNNNNAVPQATEKHVSTLKELCCRKLAQGVVVQCKKYGDEVFTSGNVAKIGKDLHLNYVCDCLDDLIKSAATMSSAQVCEGCYIDYPGCLIFSKNLIMQWDQLQRSNWELYDLETNKTTGVGKFFHTWSEIVISPCQKYVAMIFYDFFSHSVDIYEVDKILLYEREKSPIDAKLNPKRLWRYSGENQFRDACFINRSELLFCREKRNKIFSLDIFSGKRKCIYRLSELDEVHTIIRITDESVVLQYADAGFDSDASYIKRSRIVLLKRTPHRWVREDICASADKITYKENIFTVDKQHSKLVMYMDNQLKLYDLSKPQKYSVIPILMGKVVAATFSPNGECIAIKHRQESKSDPGTCFIGIYTLNGELLWTTDFFISRDTVDQVCGTPHEQITWPSYEDGITYFPEWKEPCVRRYNTAAARVLALYKKSLEQNNNNTEKK